MAALQLSNTDRSRRKKLVGMLGSGFEGEQLKALSMLQQMADAYKVPIHELLLGDGSSGAGSSFDRQQADQAAREAHRIRPGEPAADAAKLPPGWWDRFAKAQQLNRSLCFLATSETNFVAELITRGTRWPSPKQAVVIICVLEKAGVFSAATADADWEDVP